MSEYGDVELSGPDDGGWYSSQTADWIPLCPQLSDSMVRLYWICRSLVIEKHGPVRKLSLLELCYLLPAKPVEPGEEVKPSSVSRIRTLLRGLTVVGLVTTPEGKPLKTSSRAKAAAAGPLRIRVNDRPFPEYAGPRNAFAVLESVRGEAQRAAEAAARREAELEAERKAAKRSEKEGQEQLPGAGQISAPLPVGQISAPPGLISDPRGQISAPDSGADLQDRDLPFSPTAHTSPSVRPSVSTEARARDDDGMHGRTDGGDVETEPEKPERGSEVPGPAAPVARTPGVELLLAIADQEPAFLLTGQTLRDQGMVITGMLDVGWTREQLRHIVAGRPLPQPIKTTVGALVARRLRDAIAAGPPSSAPPLPRQTAPLGDGGGGWVSDDGPATPTPPAFGEHAGGAARWRECDGREGLCGGPVPPGYDQCWQCLDMPRCACGGPRYDPAVADGCPECREAANALTAVLTLRGA